MTRSLIVSSLLATCAFAQTPARVGDLLTTGSGLRNTEFVRGATVGSTLVFGAKQPATGYEVWATDGSSAGTRLLTDLAPGTASSLGGPFVAHAGRVYFLGTDGIRDALWRTDGTVAGTTLVASRRCETLQPVGTQLWCITTRSNSLFIVDSSGVGSDVPLTLYGQPWDGASIGTTLFYPSSDGELWKTDGVTAARVRDLRPTSTTRSLRSPIVGMGPRVYFAADDGVSGLELWSSDGTSAGTTLVADIVAGSGGGLVEGITVPVKLWATSTKLYFFARTGVGIELWVSDGTSVGTRLVGDLTPAGDTFTATSDIVVFQDQVFFSGGDGELWKSDGTTAGTVQVKDLLPGTSRASPNDFFVSGTQLFFTARNSSGSLELWRTDGTNGGTVLLQPRSALQPQSDALVGTVGSLTVFKANDAVVGTEPWVSDGTPTGTRLLADVNPGPDYAFSSPMGFAKFGTSLLFAARVTSGAQSLYRSNGTLAGTQVLEAGLYDVRTIFSNDTRAWFVANRRELWTTDGTAAGTHMLKQFATQTFDDSVSALTLTANGVFFVANDPSTGQEPWFSDGTVSGTRLVKDLTPGAPGTAMGSLVMFGGSAYFATSNSSGSSVMKTDFTANGTVVVKAFPGEYVTGLTLVGQRLIGFANQRNKLVVSDGTPAGTSTVDLGAATMQIVGLSTLGSALIVRVLVPNGSGSADDIAELWTSDGTAGNTRQLAVLGSPWQTLLADNSWFYASSGVVGSSLVFAFASTTTVKLWVTDGTPTGTKVLKDLAGSSRSDVAWTLRFGAAGGQLYFAASDGVNGTELWRTDGTTTGTTMVADLVPGAGSSSPAGFFLVEPSLYFSAFDANGDEELWKLDLGLDSTPPVITPVLTGTMGQAGWYTSNVGVSFQVTDPESAVSAMTGCAATTISMDTMGQTFTCTATSRGGTAMNSVTVKRDATAPVFTCPMPQTVEATASSGALVSFTLPTANDAYSGMTPVQASSLSGGTFPLGDSDIVFTSNDAAGNVGRCTTRITVKDTIAPIITCPPDATLKSTTFGPPLLSVRATAMDVVDPTPMVTQSVGDGIALVLGSNRITATATDASGNHSSCEFTLLVEPADPGMTMNPMPMNPTPTGCGCSGGGVGPLLAGALLLLLRARARDSR